MPAQGTIQRAQEDKRQGKSPTTQAGEFVREEMDHIRAGKHGARSTKQAISIGLSKARSAGVDLPPPEKGKTTERTRRNAERAYARGHGKRKRAASPKRSRAVRGALKREGKRAASRAALSRQAHTAAATRQRSASSRSAAARKAVRTKGAAKRSAAARKAARTRASHRHAHAS